MLTSLTLRGAAAEVGKVAKDVAAKGKPTLLYADDTLAGAMLAFARAGVDVEIAEGVVHVVADVVGDAQRALKLDRELRLRVHLGKREDEGVVYRPYTMPVLEGDDTASDSPHIYVALNCQSAEDGEQAAPRADGYVQGASSLAVPLESDVVVTVEGWLGDAEQDSSVLAGPPQAIGPVVFRCLDERGLLKVS